MILDILPNELVYIIAQHIGYHKYPSLKEVIYIDTNDAMPSNQNTLFFESKTTSFKNSYMRSLHFHVILCNLTNENLKEVLTYIHSIVGFTHFEINFEINPPKWYCLTNLKQTNEATIFMTQLINKKIE